LGRGEVVILIPASQLVPANHPSIRAVARTTRRKLLTTSVIVTIPTSPRNDSHESAVGGYRKPADFMLQHQARSIFHAVAGRDCNDRRSHRGLHAGTALVLGSAPGAMRRVRQIAGKDPRQIVGNDRFRQSAMLTLVNRSTCPSELPWRSACA
jgi:hypothetical protein